MRFIIQLIRIGIRDKPQQFCPEAFTSGDFSDQEYGRVASYRKPVGEPEPAWFKAM